MGIGWMEAGLLVLSYYLLGGFLTGCWIVLFKDGRNSRTLGSGTLANDAVSGQSSLLKSKGITLLNGEFGLRLTKHARLWGLDFDVTSSPYGESLDCSFGAVPFQLEGVATASGVSGKAIGANTGLSFVFHQNVLSPSETLPPVLADRTHEAPYFVTIPLTHSIALEKSVTAWAIKASSCRTKAMICLNPTGFRSLRSETRISGECWDA